MTKTLETAYLAETDPRRQSGFNGDDARWKRGRRVIVEAIHRDGSLLDIGCANGYLMETLSAWAAERGTMLDPWGLDISPKLADLARLRLPYWSDQIFTGNAMLWEPPRRFDFVRTEIVYVPEHDQPAYLARLLQVMLVPGGRLIVCSYGSSRRPEAGVAPTAEILRR
jgi:SAM-dependent methyltransferase